MNLVIGAATGYTFDQIKPFLFTLKNSGFKGDICLLVNHQNKPGDIKRLKQEGVITYRIQKYLDFLPRFISERRFSRILKPFHWLLPKLAAALPLNDTRKTLLAGKISSFFLSVACSRYYYYYRFLLKNTDKYKFVMMSDIKDVIFQADPFKQLTEQNFLLFAMEHKDCLIGKEPSNSRWINHLYGKQEMDKIGNEIVSCSGTTIAQIDYCKDYLTKMIRETASHTHKIVGAYGFDQGIHNYLLRTNRFKKFEMQYNGKGIYCTMLTTPPKEFLLNEKNELINKDGTVVPVVHQYNWFPNIDLLALNILQHKS